MLTPLSTVREGSRMKVTVYDQRRANKDDEGLIGAVELPIAEKLDAIVDSRNGMGTG